MSQIILKTENLCKKYGNQTALDSVSLQIKRGDIYGLIGENGAGKTTFMRCISGLIRSNSGDVFIFENSNFKEELGRVGFLIPTDEPAFLYLNNTATENLTIYCKLQNVKLGIIPFLLERVNLDNVGSKKVKDFSRGMKQQLRIAMALVSNPEFLVLDEPSEGLDPPSRKGLTKIIKKLNEDGVTMLVSNHVLSELKEYATKYGVIHKGRLIHECEASEIEKKELMEIFQESIGGVRNEEFATV